MKVQMPINNFRRQFRDDIFIRLNVSFWILGLADDLSGFLSVLGEMELIISSKGGGQEYSVDTCSDIDDILPTMLVCRQFFALQTSYYTL